MRNLIFAVALLVVLSLCACTEEPIQEDPEPVSSGPVFTLSQTFTTPDLVYEEAFQSDIDEEKLLRVYEDDMLAEGYSSCIVQYVGETRGIYMTEGVIEVDVKIKNGKYAGKTSQTVRYAVKDGELVEL